MSLTRILNCLSPANPEVNSMPEYESGRGFILKLAGEFEAGISALIYFNTDDVKTAVISGAIGVGLYIAGAISDYLTLRKADQIQAELKQHEKDIRELSPLEYNKKYNREATPFL